MRKFALIAMLMALLTSLLMGGTASAQAGTDSWTQAAADSWECKNEKPKEQVTCTKDEITVIIKNVKITNIKIGIIEDSFNKNKVIVELIRTGKITAAKKIVIVFFKDVDIDINIKDINICVFSTCK